MKKSVIVLLGLIAAIILSPEQLLAQDRNNNRQTLNLKMSFGLKGPIQKDRKIELSASVPGMEIAKMTGIGLESDDEMDGGLSLTYGAGDIDELVSKISWEKPTLDSLKIYDRAHMWEYLMEHGSPGQVERLSKDRWNIPDAPILAVRLNKEGTEGFSFSMDQLLENGAMWLPEQDIYITNADRPIDFDIHLTSLEGTRILEAVNMQPDATFGQFKSVWKDLGNPLVYDPPWETKYMGTTGQITLTVAAHGSIYKFAVDRWGKVRPDFASPHRFRMDPIWEGSQWKSQSIENGLPILITDLEKNGRSMEMVQFAAPLGDIDAAIRGYIPSVFFTKVKISGKSGAITYKVGLADEIKAREMGLKKTHGNWKVFDKRTGDILFQVETEDSFKVQMESDPSFEKGPKVNLIITGNLKEGRPTEVLMKLPSPSIRSSQEAKLDAIDFTSAKNKTVAYWNHWIDQGAQFKVPEKEVNELFRANLWHALTLPRHTIGSKGEDHMDLPYANTAYGQENSDWPINQGVYVDYMIYGLRGYDEVALDEIKAMFQTQQQVDGRIGGFANWGVYSPGHLYTIAQNYLLSGNREGFEQVLPNAIKTLDWCLGQIAASNAKENSNGLIIGALNDLSIAEKEWAFTQAYYVAGLELFGRALARYNHPRAEEVKKASATMRNDVVNQFARSSVKSPIVQLADGTWINYVPTDALTPRRLMDQWYPTDVDTGPLHLSRLGVLDPYSWLTTAMLNDHEDNLFLNNNGAANEPIYVQQANTYLLRDEPKAVIRSFYSLMACGFSQGQYTPIEHRWAHPQYYGPPSTDGAWFEIYRKMLLNEIGEDTLMIGQAIPRTWLENGKQISVKDAPTYFGPVTFAIEGQNANHEIVAEIKLSNRNLPKELLVRFRHPKERPIRSVTVNGKKWSDFDVQKEYIRIPAPEAGSYTISATY